MDDFQKQAVTMMTRRAAKITMLPSQGLSAKLAGAVMPALQVSPAQPEKKLRAARGRVVALETHVTMRPSTR